MALIGGDADTKFTLPNYELDRVIARGGMSVVYHGERVSDHLEIALKLITPEYSTLAEYLEKLFQKFLE